jgi:outer membrane protein insertion porin family
MVKIFQTAFIFVCLSLFSISNAEIVKKIEISGNKRISDETIKVYGEINELNSDFSKKDLNSILKNLYSTNFFQNVSVEIKDNILYVELDEYPIVNQLLIIGEKSNKFKEKIKEIISTKEKGSFIENNLNTDINKIKTMYSSNGYNFAKVESKIKKTDNKNFDLIYNIERGKLTKISKITFTGDKKIKEKRLRDVIASEEDKFWKVISRNSRFSENLINLDKRLLTNYYKSTGYYDVKVNSTSAELSDNTKIKLNYNIDAGQRYFIDKISTTVDPIFDKEIFFPLKASYEKIIGEYYSPFKVKNLLDELDELIENNNLQFIEHRVRENISEDKISLVLEIYEGEKVTVERINVLGNNVTNEDVIRSELILDEGDPFTNIRLDKSISSIKARNIFKTVKKTVKAGSSDDYKIIDIRVEEQPTGEISAGAGIGTDGGSFAFNIQENNWLGEGKKIGADFEVSTDSLAGEFTYIDPNYDLLGNQLRYSVASVKNDKPNQGYENSILTTSVGTSFEQYRNIYTNLSLYASHDDLKTNSNASTSLQNQRGKFSEIAGEYGFTNDQRNRKFAPTSGSITRFSQSLPFYADKPFISNSLSSSVYKSFGENVISSGRISLDAINGLKNENVRLSKRKIVSTKRLRGFEKGKVGPKDGDDHIGGNYVATLNFDAKLPNFLPESYNTDLGFFLDFGNIWGVDYDSSIDESRTLRSSTGLAASWLSPLGPLSFTLATNLAKASTDKTESFNFSLGTQF